MPRYDYICEACTHTFEKDVPLKEFAEWQVCPACGFKAAHTEIKKAPGVIFKGPGWTPKGGA